MNPLAARATTAVLIGLVILSATGCYRTSSPKPAAKTPPSTDASAQVTAETSATTEVAASGVVTPTATEPAPSPAPSQPEPAQTVQLGPVGASVSWAYLKDMYQKNGAWYVVVDYVQVVGPEESLHFVNENPMLRTFPLSSSAKLLLLKDSGSPDYKTVSVTQLKAFEGKPGDEVVEVTPKGGYAAQLKEWWAP